MSRYIDADKIIYSWQIDPDGQEHDGVTLQSIINKMPSIDAVQVIRCKDCKYYKENTLACGRYGLEDDDYCSWAERKESWQSVSKCGLYGENKT